MHPTRQRAFFSWFSIGALCGLCALLGYLQYTWIGEVSVVERDRLRSTLQSSLGRLAVDFNTEMATAALSVMPRRGRREAAGDPSIEEQYASRYAQWRENSPQGPLLARVGLAIPHGEKLEYRMLEGEDPEVVQPGWPSSWDPVRKWVQSRWHTEFRPGERGPGFFSLGSLDPSLLELPRFRFPEPGGGPPPGPMPGGGPGGVGFRRENGWIFLQVDLAYVRGTLLPELLQRHLGTGSKAEYQIEVVARGDRNQLIYASDPNAKERIGESPDAAVSLFELQFDQLMRRSLIRRDMPKQGPPRDAAERESQRRRAAVMAAPERGRWQILARHKSGSLEALVARTRWRNIAVTGTLLALLLATVIAWFRVSRRAQRLAELQIDFVAGVSHELRTPLTVIRTAAFNLRGKMAQNPALVERYGQLIQEESEKLTALVEQVLQFASARAGRVIRDREPLAVDALIAQAVQAAQPMLDSFGSAVETRLEPGLPRILGDPLALGQVLQNLLSNAAKYGGGQANWIGITAALASPGEVEIRVADHGPGIPAEEQPHIFEPFYRGKRALQEQIHGTGLGLSLVKGIIEAHQGAIAVESQAEEGTSFVLRLPVAPAAEQHELTNLTD